MAQVLVVEDDEIIQRILEKSLRSRGHSVIFAVNGGEGIAAARREQPDIILMDVRLPIVSGIKATRQLKAMPETQHIPIIAVTAITTAENLRQCFDAGCDAYMGKPIQFTQLHTKIDMFLDRKGDA